MITVSYDAENGIISLTAIGMLTTDDVNKAGGETVTFMNKARAQFGRGLFLINGNEAPVQPRDVIQATEKLGSFLTGASDKLAVVVSSNLAKMQAKRIFTSPHEGVFLSLEEARAWLLADGF